MSCSMMAWQAKNKYRKSDRSLGTMVPLGASRLRSGSCSRPLDYLVHLPSVTPYHFNILLQIPPPPRALSAHYMKSHAPDDPSDDRVRRRKPSTPAVRLGSAPLLPIDPHPSTPRCSARASRRVP